MDDSVIYLPALPCIPNLILHNILVTSKLIKKLITDLDLPKRSSPDCIPVIVSQTVGSFHLW